MKKLYFILLTFLPVCIIAQNWNPSFENWEMIDGTESPTKWNLSQDSSQVRFEKSTDAFDGLYSMKIYPAESDAFYYCKNATFQYVYPDMEITDSTNVSCYFKTESLNDDQSVSLKISVYFYREDNSLISYQLTQVDEVVEEYQYLPLGIFPDSTDYIDIFIEAGGAINPEDECFAQSIAWVDKFVISNEIISNTQISDQSQKLSAVPNPFIRNTRISGLNSDQFTLQIFSINGIEFFDYQLDGKQLSINKKGIFVLKITEEGQFPRFVKIVSM